MPRMRHLLLEDLMKAGIYKVLQFAKPVIRIPYELRGQLLALVNGTNHNECQWFHCITKSYGGAKKDIIYYDLDGIYIPKQVVGGASVESPGEGLLGIWNELKATYLLEDGTTDKERCNQRFQTMNCWAHSHVNMAVNPSTTDESTFRQWIEQSSGTIHPTIMMIVNKREEVFIRLYDPEEGIYCENPEIIMSLPPPVDLTYVQDAIATKITSRSYTSTSFIGSNLGFNRHHHHQLGQSSSTEVGQKKTPIPNLIGETSTVDSGEATVSEVEDLVKSGKRLCKNKINLETNLQIITDTNDNEMSSNMVAKDVQDILINVHAQVVFLLLLKSFYMQDTALLAKILTFWQNKEGQMIKGEDVQNNISHFLHNEYLGPNSGFFAALVIAKRITYVLDQAISMETKMRIITKFLNDLDYVIIANTDFSSVGNV